MLDPFFTLLHSETPMDYMGRAVGEINDKYSQESVDAPVKRVVLQLLNSPTDTKSRDMGLILGAPDMPPVAVHMDDVDYAVAQQAHNEYDDLNLSVINKVANLFGDEAVEHLSDETCLMLIQAIQSSDVRTAINP
jgi:hypothetical protein